MGCLRIRRMDQTWLSLNHTVARAIGGGVFRMDQRRAGLSENRAGVALKGPQRSSTVGRVA